MAFNLDETLHKLKHYLPSQAPLKDFIHHNTLHAFQDMNFHKALHFASENFGYRVYLSIKEYRDLFNQNKISKEVFEFILLKEKGANELNDWTNKLLYSKLSEQITPRIGALKNQWTTLFQIDLDAQVHPLLFRTICSYLDQGVAIWQFPTNQLGFLKSLAKLERNSLSSFFKTTRARNLLISGKHDLLKLLKIVVGDENLYEQYLFDLEFSHPGWSGMVSVIDEKPDTLLDKRKVTLYDLIYFELLLQIDILDSCYGEIWSPIGLHVNKKNAKFLIVPKESELFEIYKIWQEIYEENYYQQVLNGLKQNVNTVQDSKVSFQAVFCIDDRECSIRRHVEEVDNSAITFGTAGHFNLEFYFQPSEGLFYSKVCPAMISPKILIKEEVKTKHKRREFHFSKYVNGLFLGWIYTHLFAVWSIFQLIIGVFKPSESSSSVSSFKHMHKNSHLTIENKNEEKSKDGLQVGFKLNEMADRMEGLLRSIGLIDHFAPIVYFVGHGSSSVNNTHYAGYDCGACSGRPGSVNARVIADIGNRKEVKELLINRGIVIPDETVFIGSLQDTARDEMVFYDIEKLNDFHADMHKENVIKFEKALLENAVERSRRFYSINSRGSKHKIHDLVKDRTLSLFEPRPEYNHATNSLCIVGRRSFSKNLFLDRRAFLNSYDYTVDRDGKYLLGILNAVAPVCGGINLEYYFSRVDNENLGAGTKLPHNAMGLIGVANGIDGDLRTGLPNQMVEIHDPLRLMVIVEHYPDVVLDTINKNPSTFQWFDNEWIKLVVVNPETDEIFEYQKNKFQKKDLLDFKIEELSELKFPVEYYSENLPILKVS